MRFRVPWHGNIELSTTLPRFACMTVGSRILANKGMRLFLVFRMGFGSLKPMFKIPTNEPCAPANPNWLFSMAVEKMSRHVATLYHGRNSAKRSTPESGNLSAFPRNMRRKSAPIADGFGFVVVGVILSVVCKLHWIWQSIAGMRFAKTGVGNQAAHGARRLASADNVGAPLAHGLAEGSNSITVTVLLLTSTKGEASCTRTQSRLVTPLRPTPRTW